MKKMAVQHSTGIVIDPSVRSGHPVIRGTRVPVDIVVGRVDVVSFNGLYRRYTDWNGCAQSG